MPLDAQSLAAVIGGVWEDINRRPSGTRFTLPDGMLCEALNGTQMFSEIPAHLDRLSHERQHAIWFHGLLIGIEIGKAIRDIEDLEEFAR